MSASREAFDLFNPACRRNYRESFYKKRWDWKWWWLVIHDTFFHVCPNRGE